MDLMEAPAVMDIEASGFGAGSYPIEVGFVAPSGGPFCSLIQPLPEWRHWDAKAEALHGISREILHSKGRSPLWVAAELNQRLAGQIVYCDGWGHDYSWLGRLFDAAELQPAFRLQDIRVLLSDAEAAQWHELTQTVRQEQQLRRHRASTDARVLQLSLLRLRSGDGAPARKEPGSRCAPDQPSMSPPR
ncbi:MAG: hypothetical protein ACK4S6_09875 [Roseateles asaccharophilus]|uniref:3'-5' exonuclease n=1 Tax=Roseateles asaccharophilus TaxID=582607 RepID=UPI00391A8228